MRKHTATLEWQIAPNDREWEQVDQPAPTMLGPRRLPPGLGEVLLLLCVLGSIGGWHWYTTQAEWQQAQTELLAAVQQEVTVAPPAWSATTPVARLEPLQAEHALPVAVKPKLSGAQLASTIRVLKLQGDQAVVLVLTPAMAHAPAYRHTQFYRRTVAGWQRKAPDTALWGPPRQLETASFRWRYQENDAQVVATVAPQMELIYATLRRDFGLANVPQADKLLIEVRVTQPAGKVSPWFGVAVAYGVTSPALYRAPLDLTDAELLAQSLALPLLNTVMAQAREYYQLHASWQPLLQGLRLWQFWDLDLPLSTWHQEVAAWLYAKLTGADGEQRVVLPAHYAELCAAHTLWLPSPMQIGIPLACNELDRQAGYFATTGGRNLAPHLTHLSAPTSGAYVEPSAQGIDPRGQAVVLVTLIEYAVAVYGRERLPPLVASLREHKSWETLLPAVYGISAAEFEAGWLEYLATHYSSYREGGGEIKQ